MDNTDVLEQQEQDDHHILCDKEITIYHIPKLKVGSSSRLKARLKQQGYCLDDCEILHTIKADTTTYRKVWELEQQEAEKRGYAVENEGNWATFYNAHTNNCLKDADVLAKLVKAKNTPEYKKRKSDKATAQWSCQKARAELSATLSDGRRAGFKNSHAKTANVYNRKDEIVAAGVCLNVYARENNYDPSTLQATARADRSKPHNWKTNRHYHKGIRAEYI